MSIKTNKLLLVVMILTLVITPLRGAWAMSSPTNADSTPHCTQMDMPAGEQQADSTAESGHQCETGCNGDCCDGNCNACAHSVISLPDSVKVTRAIHDAPPAVPFLAAFPHRTVIPPLRPPASL